MGGRKTAGVVFSEAFELIKREYKVLWVTALIMYGVNLVLGLVTSVVTAPFQIFSAVLGPMIDGLRQGGMESAGYWVRGLAPAAGVFGVLYMVVMVVSIAVGIAQKAAEVGAKNATLQLLDGGRPRLDAVWQNFAQNWKRYVGITAWTMLWTFLWTLLFIVPGIVKAYSYRLAPYLMVEYPDMTVREALVKSMEMTRGYKGRLFLLDIIVWAFGVASIIGICALIIGWFAIILLWVTPLSYAMFAIAYRDIKASAVERGILPASPV